MKQNFEQFLMEKHAEDYIGVKDAMVDNFNDWLCNLDADEFLAFGDLFAKKQSKKLLEALHLILPLAKGYVAVKQVGSNQKYINIAEQAITKAGGNE